MAARVVVVIVFVVVVRPTQTQLFGPKDKKGGLENEQSQNMSNNNSKVKGRRGVGEKQYKKTQHRVQQQQFSNWKCNTISKGWALIGRDYVSLGTCLSV